MNKYIYIFFAGLLFLGLTGCTEKEPVMTLDQVLYISDFAYTLKDKPAVIIAIGKDKDNGVQIIIQRGQIRTGYTSIFPSKIPINPMRLDGGWDGQSYSLSKKHDTNAEFRIKRIDRSKGVATISVTGRLINARDFSKFITIPETTLEITGENFNNFIL